MVNRVADLPLALVIAAARRAGRGADPDRAARRRPTVARATVARRRSRRWRASERAAVHEATGGNPFYVHALLAEDGTSRARWSTRSRCGSSGCRPACTALARALAVLDGMASGTVAARSPGSTSAPPSRPSRRCSAPTSCAARPSRIRSSRRGLRGDPGPRRAARRRRPPADHGPEHVAAQLLAAGPGGGVWTVEPLREPPRTRVGPRRARRGRDAPAPRRRGGAAARRSSSPLLRELARALVAAEGPDGLPVMREALALASRRRSAERSPWSSAARCSPTATSRTPARRWRPAAHTRRARDRRGARPLARAALRRPRRDRRSACAGSPVAAWIEVARARRRTAEQAEAALARRAAAERARRRRWSRCWRPGRYERADADLDRDRRAAARAAASSRRCGWRSRCGRWCACAPGGSPTSRPTCAG